MSLYVKACAVAASCRNARQAETAKRFAMLAMRREQQQKQKTFDALGNEYFGERLAILHKYYEIAKALDARVYDDRRRPWGIWSA